MSCSSSSSPFRIPLSLWCEASGMCKILTEQISLISGLGGARNKKRINRRPGCVNLEGF